MTDKLLKKVEPRKVVLADGKEYKLGPVSLNVLANLEEEFGCGLNELSKKFGKQQASSFRLLLFVMLRENYPEITKEQAGKLVSMELIPEISNVINAGAFCGYLEGVKLNGIWHW